MTGDSINVYRLRIILQKYIKTLNHFRSGRNGCFGLNGFIDFEINYIFLQLIKRIPKSYTSRNYKKVRIMRKLLLIGLIGVSFMSCTVTTYMSNDLSSNYQLKMTSKKERVLVEKIPVYMSEKDIPGEFIVKSINAYSPIVLPVIGNRKKAISEHLYKKAVKTAQDQNGNAVLIMDEAHFKVITVK